MKGMETIETNRLTGRQTEIDMDILRNVEG